MTCFSNWLLRFALAITAPKLRLRAALLVGLIVLCSAQVATAETDDDFEIWTAAFVTAQFRETAPGPTLWFDVHARRADAGSVLILRPGVGYAFNSWASVWVGYAWNPVFKDASHERVDVQGPWEQLTLNYGKNPKMVLQSRTRFEQFWSDAGDKMYPRLREFGRFNYRPSSSVPVGVAIFDEVFFGLKDVDWAHKGFFENRIFAGLAIFDSSGVFRVEPGYMFVNIKRGENKLLGHVLSLNFFLNFKPKPKSEKPPNRGECAQTPAVAAQPRSARGI